MLYLVCMRTDLYVLILEAFYRYEINFMRLRKYNICVHLMCTTHLYICTYVHDVSAVEIKLILHLAFL